MLGMLGERAMEAVSQDWRAWVVGIFSATVCRLNGLARFTPGVGYTLDIWASLISFLRLPFTRMNNDHLFH